MILANLTKAIREQNWFAVVVEFLIVIAGVVIGFQISAWNEAKRDRAYERSLLESLHQEVSSLRQLREAEIQPVLDRSGLLSSLIRRVHGADRGGDVLIDECIALSNSHVFRQLPDVLPSLAELSTSGGKQVISDTDVRREILQFIQERERARAAYREVSLSPLRIGVAYPEILQTNIVSIDQMPEAVVDRFQSNPLETDELPIGFDCDLDGMRESNGVKSMLVDNMGRTAAYIEGSYHPLQARLSEMETILSQALEH